MVNTVLERTTVSAVSKSNPASTNSRMRSAPRNPAWPSFMWNTSGAGSPSIGREGANRSYAADAGQDLLLHAMFLIAAVEAVGDPAQVVLVLRDVGIQQQQRNTTDLRHPDLRMQSAAVRQCQLNQRGRAGTVGEQPQRQPQRVERRVVFVLPTVGGQRLPEVAGAVVQAHRDQRQSEIRRGLQMVAGQDSQATRVVRQHLGDPELHRKIGDAVGHGSAVLVLLLVPQRAAQIIVQIGGQMIEPVQESAVDRQFVQPCRAHRAQQRNGILTALHPQVRVDRAEEILRRLVPRPTQVGRQLS